MMTINEGKELLAESDIGTLPWRQHGDRGFICDFGDHMSSLSNDADGRVRHIVCTVRPNSGGWTWQVTEEVEGVRLNEEGRAEEVKFFKTEDTAANVDNARFAAERMAAMLSGYGGNGNVEGELYYGLARELANAAGTMTAFEVRAILQQFLAAYAAGAKLPVVPEAPTGKRSYWFK